MNAPTLRAANRQAFYKTEVVAMGEFERRPFDDIGTDTNIPADSEREFSAKIADVDILGRLHVLLCDVQSPDLH